MNQSQLLALMAELAQEEQALEPDDAMAFLAEYLERTRLEMDQTDSERRIQQCTDSFKPAQS